MSEPLSLFENQLQQEVSSNQSLKNDLTIDDTYTEELVFGLCGPIGSPIHRVAEVFKETFEENYGYDCVIIRLSEFIVDELKKDDSAKIDFNDQYDKLNNLTCVKLRP
jgi:hypothetical protein